MMDVAPQLFAIRVTTKHGNMFRDGLGFLFTDTELHDELMSDNPRHHNRLQRSLDRGRGTFIHDGAVCHLESCDAAAVSKAWAIRWAHVMAESARWTAQTQVQRERARRQDEIIERLQSALSK